MSSMIPSLKDLIEKPIRECFYSIMNDAITDIEAEMKKRIESLAEEQRKEARHAANKMAVEMLHKANINGISLELKT